jgi:hypothetical protein
MNSQVEEHPTIVLHIQCSNTICDFSNPVTLQEESEIWPNNTNFDPTVFLLQWQGWGLATITRHTFDLHLLTWNYYHQHLRRKNMTSMLPHQKVAVIEPLTNPNKLYRNWQFLSREKSIHKCFRIERLQVIEPLPNPNKFYRDRKFIHDAYLSDQ